MNKAIAIFAKTPQLSLCKTRLAAHIGQEAATEFYCLCLAAIEELTIALTALGYDCWWAVAEKEGVEHPFWKNKPVRYAGEGALGDKLHYTYSQLRNEYSHVGLMGADAPQFTAAFIENAMNKLATHAFTISPASDGGFTLFCGSAPIEESVWTTTPYSVNTTLEKLVAQLKNYYLLPTYTDVDNFQDLHGLMAQMPEHPSNAQHAIMQWIIKNA
ncbi:MAG: DUF2064 domain-containing protein [Alphaproteobacteria bacterium]|nr:DUF2064 domain-containing protein [Alphaproteobacteria bacterium]